MDERTPAYLSGHLAPVPDEIDAVDLPVTGALPAELVGRYFRNGPNPLPGEVSPHWFAGHGMLHGLRLRDGRAEWYRNRWVRTSRLDGVPPVDERGNRDLAAVTANTHVIEHAGRLLALVENGLPHEVGRELETVGPCDFGGRLTTAMTAHPKQDPVTGELHFFGYGVRPPYLTYHRLSAAGELELSLPVDVPGPTMMHDFAITEHHVVWLDLPVVFDMALVGRALPYRWDDDYGARIGVMAKDGGPVQWFEVESCYVFHVGNAREDAAGRVVLDAVRYDRTMWDGFWPTLGSGQEAVDTAAAGGTSTLHRWILDPASGSVAEERIDERGVEFPTLNDALVGRDNQYLYTVGERTIVKYDTRTGDGDEHDLGAGWHAGEAVFVLAADARGEDEGWLLSLVTNEDTTVPSELRVLDATDVKAGPVASVHLPRRVPTGFHGSWFPDA
ncbi:carotenoid cleavage dioxygenase [Saccharothrix tamanrassetensis]|uniref:Dioxygenase n=1 Tax=Saccharothrix tamanrassetensis TaxID=1051531 RepID=A0A841C9X3_9PSEU|nr:carotenoid oxygenase family protein [Saccharothrix tamanrassetensis]MBB5953743.1 carotenoid cleavage dioxygenase [Saccharothrix tamanrassetensis]